MRFYILTKKRILTLALSAIALTMAVIIGLQGISAVVETSSQKKKIPIYCVQKQEKQIAISFDAAWGNEQTQTLIDILAKYNVKTTFFVVGSWVDKYPESVKALANAGHEVCNHSNTHPHLPQLSKDKIISELQLCNDKIEKITGVRPKLFRPPYGDYSNSLLEAADSIGMYTIQWDVDSLDWKDPTPDQIVQRVTSGVKPGSIVLFHNGAKNTPAALPKVLEKLLADGYSIVPISQLIMKDNYTIDHEGRQIPSKSPASSGAANTSSVSSSKKAS